MAPSYSQMQKEFYDKKFSRFATKGMEENIANFYFQEMKSIIDENTAIREGSKILEVGVGSGILMEKMVSHYRQCVFKGIDISEKYVDIARQRGLDVKVADAGSLDLSEKYDFIYGTSILHHLDDVPKFMNDLSSMLNNGGSVLFGAETVSCEFAYIIYTKVRGVWEIEKGMMNLSPEKIEDWLRGDYNNIKICWHGNVFVYFSSILGTIYNALRLSKIPCLNDIYVFAQKK